MEYKFKYSAGLPGYGINGKDGSVGLSGFSIYLMDYPESGNRDNIETQIKSNKSLLSDYLNDYIPGYPIRKYQNDDIIIDNGGHVFILENIGTNLNQYRSANILLGSADFLDAVTYTSVGSDYTRYANTLQTPLAERKLIDIVFGTEKSYYNLPAASLFGVAPKDFAQIIHSSEVTGNYNPYILFNTGSADPKNALALVRDVNTGQFRLGNADNNQLVRDANLNFDIHFLTQTKGGENVQSPILTQYDLDASCLFSTQFDKVPSALSFVQDGSTVTVSWNNKTILNVLNDESINANLVVYPMSTTNADKLEYDSETGSFIHPLTGNKYRLNLINRIKSQGTLQILGLDENIEYAAYIEYDKNGWVRRTSRRTSNTPFKLIKFSQNPIYVDDFAHTLNLTVSSNTDWAVQSIPTWMSISPANGTDGTAITVNVAVQDDFAPEHYGEILFSGGGITRALKIYQSASSVQVPGADYDSGWQTMTKTSKIVNGSNYLIRIRRYGKIVVINGWISIVENAGVDSVIAYISYDSIGGPTTGPTHNVYWGGISDGNYNETDTKLANGYIPAYVEGQLNLEMKITGARAPEDLAINCVYICG